ncbi:MAG TPA: SDR family NAD(P)-dependent oxidoreductase, partial [Chloroflexaceae bacterium]|nr:SDR family NAD(P)-dependent oxidoreductase [Chloroflexaceae bacterium]
GGAAPVSVVRLDLASLVSVRACAGELRSRYERLAGLICNAGIMTPPYRRTENGYESQFQVNYLGHFLLTQLLIELLRGGASLISISSLSSEKGRCDSAEEFFAVGRCDMSSYDAMRAYRESKLAQVLFTAEAQRRLGAAGVVASAVHPGVVNTGLFYRNGPAWLQRVVQPLAWIGYATGRLRTPAQGATTAIDLGLRGTSVCGGQYWADKQPRAPNPRLYNERLCAALWEASLAAVSEPGRSVTTPAAQPSQ